MKILFIIIAIILLLAFLIGYFVIMYKLLMKSFEDMFSNDEDIEKFWDEYDIYENLYNKDKWG